MSEFKHQILIHNKTPNRAENKEATLVWVVLTNLSKQCSLDGKQQRIQNILVSTSTRHWSAATTKAAYGTKQNKLKQNMNVIW